MTSSKLIAVLDTQGVSSLPISWRPPEGESPQGGACCRVLWAWLGIRVVRGGKLGVLKLKITGKAAPERSLASDRTAGRAKGGGQAVAHQSALSAETRGKAGGRRRPEP